VSGAAGCVGAAGDAAAYALGALEPAEARSFVQHARSCVVCRDELLGFGQVASSLALAAPQLAVPRRLRRRVLAEIRSTRARPEAGRRAPAVWRLGPGLATALAAAAVAVVLALEGSGSAPARITTAQVVGVRGSASLRLSGGHTELAVHRFTPPARGDIYEVWLLRRGGALQPTTALFGVTSSGNGVVEVPGDLRHVSEVLVTQEPAGGSRVPTSAPVVVAHLT
jgi:anti-sigma-K factor RskA